MANDAIISLRLPTDLADRLRALADERGVKVSAMLREAAERLLAPAIKPGPAPAERTPVPGRSVPWHGPWAPAGSSTVTTATDGAYLVFNLHRPPDSDGTLARVA